MVTIELDTVADGIYGDTGESAGKVITEGFNVAYEVVTEHGPGGGNPVLRYVGPVDEVRRMVEMHYGPETWTDAVTLGQVRSL